MIDKENEVRSRAITIAAELPHIYVVSSGLSEGDIILPEGLRMVKENEKIECKIEDPAYVLSHLELYAE